MNDWLWVNIFHISRRVVLYWETSELGGCVKVEVAVLGSPSLIVLKVSVDVKQHELTTYSLSAERLVLHLHKIIFGDVSRTGEAFSVKWCVV